MINKDNAFLMEGEFENDQIVKGKISKLPGQILIFEGLFENSKIKKGSYHYDKNEVYVGEFVDYKRQGKGKYTYSTKDIYEGDWIKDKRHGIGSYQKDDKDGIINYNWNEDKMGNKVI